MTAVAEQPGFASAALLLNDRSSVQVALGKIDRPRLMWLNRDAIGLASAGARGSKDAPSCEAWLLASCSYLMADGGAGGVQGWADRYGGSGVGCNGGSGRSVAVNGFSVKGVGPTPLIGRTASLTHSTGGAYLEEAIREICHWRLLDQMLPHGALPILAVIDTGVDQTWQLDGGSVKTERRVLIVRPFTWRPAHFQRASYYRPVGWAEKRADRARVETNFRLSSEACGPVQVRAALSACYRKWAEQIAAARVHEISLGTTPSNLTLDAEILDFGAVSTLRQPAYTATAPGWSDEDELRTLLGSLRDLAASASAFDEFTFDGFAAEVERDVLRCFDDRIVFELLSATGLGQHHRSIAKDEAARRRILAGYDAYHLYRSRLRLDLLPSRYRLSFEAVPGLESIWRPDRPACLERLAAALSPYRAAEAPKAVSVQRWPVTREDLREEIMAFVDRHPDLGRLDEVIDDFSRRLGGYAAGDQPAREDHRRRGASSC